MDEKFLGKLSDKSSEEQYSPFPEGYKIGQTKYVIITGSVISGIGKGIFSSSLGKILQDRKLKVAPIKIEAYLNIDSGTLSPYRHGEVFVLDDGTETDMDLGSYERFLNLHLSKENFVTHGQIYQKLISKERNGDYNGRDVQFIPHVTGETKYVLRDLALKSKADIVLVEIGGTVGDYENLFAMESVRQLIYEEGQENVCLVNLTYVIEPHHLGEFKSKAAQLGLKQLMTLGLQPDVIICRSQNTVTDNIREKISMNANVPMEKVFTARDVDNIYDLPISFRTQGVDTAVLNVLNIDDKFPANGSKSLKEWTENNSVVPKKEVTIGVAGKYTGTSDTYISIVKALEHCANLLEAKLNVRWIETTSIEEGKTKAKEEMQGIDGILIPGGFGTRGIEGKIACAKYARENKIPFLGICYGFQMAVVEFARNVCNLNANSSEIDSNAEHKVIDLLDEQKNITEKGETMRLGAYKAIIKPNSIVHKLYNSLEVFERHRHRYEVNPYYHEILQNSGMVFSGISPDRKLIEFIELPKHKFFVATQAHPEFKSSLLNPAPLFDGFVKACLGKAFN